MTRSSRHAICVTLALLVAGNAFADPPPVQVIEPGTYVVPAYMPPAQPPQQALELDRRGRRKKLAGALLMGLGGALFLTGAGVFGWGFEENGCRQFDTQRSCSESPALVAGSLGMLVGLGSLIAGIPVYVVGARQVRTAKRLTGQLALGGVSLQY